MKTSLDTSVCSLSLFGSSQIVQSFQSEEGQALTDEKKMQFEHD